MGSILPGAWGDCRAVPFELSLEKTVGAHRGEGTKAPWAMGGRTGA